MGRVGLVAWACAVVLLAGCSGQTGADTDGDGTSTAGASTPPATEPSDGASAEDSSGTVADTTAPGSVLDVGDTATVAWRPAPDVEGALELGVEAVREADPADFDGLVAAGTVEGAQPYYVDVTVANAGDTDLGGFDVPLYLLDTSDTLGPPWAFAEPFRPCRSRPLPTSFEPGDSTAKCVVFFARAGASYDAMVFQPTPDQEAVSWTGEATEVDRDRARRPSRRRR